MEGCRHAWLFGDRLHVTAESGADAEKMRDVMESWNDPSLIWQAIKPSIEDRFMALMELERKDDTLTGNSL